MGAALTKRRNRSDPAVGKSPLPSQPGLLLPPVFHVNLDRLNHERCQIPVNRIVRFPKRRIVAVTGREREALLIIRRPEILDMSPPPFDARLHRRSRRPLWHRAPMSRHRPESGPTPNPPATRSSVPINPLPPERRTVRH